MSNKKQLLKDIFGYKTFRDGQEELIDSLSHGRDTLGIMPTGGGKSLCFQLPAFMSDGITLIISPLISLMRDQVATLKQLDVAAAYINSSLTPAQIRKALSNAANMQYKIIYIAPERLDTDSFMYFAKNVKINMLIVDEAHCVSQWGHDFRPSYLKIKNFVNSLPERPAVGAFTATATCTVQKDIVKQLDLQNPYTLVTGFDRPNLRYEVEPLTIKEKPDFLLKTLSDLNGQSGIIYCNTRKYVEQVCDYLNSCGYSATRYHAGLSDKERNDNQQDFIYDDKAIMVATNAFGMGIDKSNVSFVIHYNMPKDLEAYYQEAGRAGRDGMPARCILFYSKYDLKIAYFLIEKSFEDDNDETDSKTKEFLKQESINRLEIMNTYCTQPSCLRAYILNYFGQTSPTHCDNCGNCSKQTSTKNMIYEAIEITTFVKICQIKYGLLTLVDFFRGLSSSKVRNKEDYSAFGLLKQYSKAQVESILTQLLSKGYLQRSNDKYRVVFAGENCNDLTKTDSCQIIIPEKEKVKTEIKSKILQNTNSETDVELYSKLSEMRRAIAREQGIPPFVIFSNFTLKDMSAKKPLTSDDFLLVNGVGQHKLTLYGFKFISAIKEYCASKDDY